MWLIDRVKVLWTGAGAQQPGPDVGAKRATADFNGDGKADILWQNDNGTPAVWLMDGGGRACDGSGAGRFRGPSWRRRCREISTATAMPTEPRAERRRNTGGLADGWRERSRDGTCAAQPGCPRRTSKEAIDSERRRDGRYPVAERQQAAPAVWTMHGVDVFQIGGRRSTIRVRPGTSSDDLRAKPTNGRADLDVRPPAFRSGRWPPRQFHLTTRPRLDCPLRIRRTHARSRDPRLYANHTRGLV